MRVTLADKARERLLADIQCGIFAVGTQLPAEPELAARYSVSRPTIRETIQGLIMAGYVQRRHGTGTFVTTVPRWRNSLEVTVSGSALIREAGMQAGEKIIDARERAPLRREVEALEVDSNARVIALERIKTADGVPAIYSRDTIPSDCVPGTHYNEIHDSIYGLLEGHGITILSAFATLRAVRAGVRVAENLGVSSGTAVQYLEQIDYDQNGRPVIFSMEWYAPDVFELCVNRRRVDTSGWKRKGIEIATPPQRNRRRGTGS